ncbi:NAD-dependent epimerase/dehydratase family protein [Dyella sp. KULCS107]|uniref:NAD-dependent epimerase/dehydratase family protein n=1 Tax=Dyella sp. KULCS107 TaxID=3422216 RepID=UPI003D6DC0C8
MSERVLLAGCGDLGERVARRLLARGDTVFALRRHPPAHSVDGITWLAGDMTQPSRLPSLPPGITQLVHLPTPGARDAAAYRAVFVDGLRHVITALDAVALKRVLFVSSTAVYGEAGGAWVDEETPPDPPGFNGAVLWEAERWLAAQPSTGIALRLAGLYGPGRLQLIERLRAGAASVPRAQTHWSNRIHVEDAAAAIVHLLALPDPQALYIGADDTPLPIDVLYDHLAVLAGAPRPAGGPAPADVASKRLSNTRLRASGWAPRWPDARDGYAALLAGQPGAA